jgi:hypothetical protein
VDYEISSCRIIKLSKVLKLELKNFKIKLKLGVELGISLCLSGSHDLAEKWLKVIINTNNQ